MDNALCVFFFARGAAFDDVASKKEAEASFPLGLPKGVREVASPPYRERSFASTFPSSAFPLETTSARTPMSVAVCSARLSRHSPGTTRHVGAMLLVSAQGIAVPEGCLR